MIAKKILLELIEESEDVKIELIEMNEKSWKVIISGKEKQNKTKQCFNKKQEELLKNMQAKTILDTVPAMIETISSTLLEKQLKPITTKIDTLHKKVNELDVENFNTKQKKEDK